MSSRPRILVRPAANADRDWLKSAISERLGDLRQASRGRLMRLDEHDALIAWSGEERIAFLAYFIEGSECEISGLASVVENLGAGTALIDAVKDQASKAGCKRLRVVTTNDNTHAIRFYQRRSFRIAAVRVGRIDDYRRTLKPEIPATGHDGIPIRDEVELEMRLAEARM